mmetsp:Transcript_7588/g.9143  ORF Transcript_7588/g.9143 Transcript_7588/m.9143 type:complete len:412 (+) Transcript_7588:157-1392(+)
MSSTKVKKQLKALLKAPDNRFCADCPQKKPTWASINIGVFLCLQCAGIHRDMGVHITKVRSVELDTWKPEWVAVMKKWGNRKANAYWEANCPSGYAGRPTEEEALALSFKLKKFIRDKYDRKLWVAKDGDAVPADSQNDVVSAEESDEIDEEAERRRRRRQARKKKKEKEMQAAKQKTKMSAEPTPPTEELDLFGESMTSKAESSDGLDLFSSQFEELQVNSNSSNAQQQQHVPTSQPTQQTNSHQSKTANIMAMFSQGSTQGTTYGQGLGGNQLPYARNPIQQQPMMQTQPMMNSMNARPVYQQTQNNMQANSMQNLSSGTMFNNMQQSQGSHFQSMNAQTNLMQPGKPLNQQANTMQGASMQQFQMNPSQIGMAQRPMMNLMQPAKGLQSQPTTMQPGILQPTKYGGSK